MDTIVINLFGAPGSGKSTGAAYIFARLKMKGIDAELVTEFAKDKVWEGTNKPLQNQCYVFGEQEFRLNRCNGLVDVIVTDSPIPLSIVYNNQPNLGEDFNRTVMNVFNSYKNLNYYLKRVKPYSENGRLQSERESNDIGDKILKTITERQIEFREIDGDMAGYNEIIEDVIAHIPSIDTSDINDFSGKYYFLSNFYVTNFTYNSMTFTNTEAAFHSMKCPERAEEFCNLSPSAAKKLGRQVKLRADWEEIKKQVMYDVCLAKFSQNKDLKEKLLATGNRTLIEGNFWNDKCWGVCNGEGENNLGKILMKIRDNFRHNQR